jgi:hypothetical protein
MDVGTLEIPNNLRRVSLKRSGFDIGLESKIAEPSYKSRYRPLNKRAPNPASF